MNSKTGVWIRGSTLTIHRCREARPVKPRRSSDVRPKELTSEISPRPASHGPSQAAECEPDAWTVPPRFGPLPAADYTPITHPGRSTGYRLDSLAS